MAKTTRKKRISAYWLSLYICIGFLAALGIAALILGLVPVNTGVNPADKPDSFQIAKTGFALGVDETADSKAVNSTRANYDDMIREYRNLTGYSALRGVLEGVGGPRAKFDKSVKPSDVTGLSHDAEKSEYFILVRYAETQTMTFKYADDGSKEETVEFDRVAVRVGNENVIAELTAFAFLKDELNAEDYHPAQISITANQVGLYRFCDRLFI
ncbi:hypothetical protein FACS1894211_05180 [Clostridia bacterium]|nr:hypothetical protein FACS1894211_05180 [Clostridia bacterium]